MSTSNSNQGVRLGLIGVAVVFCALAVALVWQFKIRTTPADNPTGGSELAVGQPDETRAPGYLARMGFKSRVARSPSEAGDRGAAPAAPVARPLTAYVPASATPPDVGTGTGGPAVTAAFDSRAKGVQIAEAVRNAVARVEESGAGATGGDAADPATFVATTRVKAAAPSVQASGSSAAAGLTTPTSASRSASASSMRGPVASVSTMATVTGSQRSSGAAAGSAGGAGGGSDAGGNVGGGGRSTGGYQVPVSQINGKLGLPEASNPVEAFREGVPVRRAVVEELRQKRILDILEARQKEGQ